MILRPFIALLCCALLGWSALAPDANAKLFQRKKAKQDAAAVEKVQTFQPPPENAVTMYCEPYRREAAELSQKPRLVKIFYEPRRSWLMNKHRKCKSNLMAQEHLYLKHVDIEREPSLPRMKMEVTPITPIGPTSPSSGAEYGAK